MLQDRLSQQEIDKLMVKYAAYRMWNISELCLTEKGTVTRFMCMIVGHSSRDILPFTVLSKRFFALLMNAYKHKIKVYRYWYLLKLGLGIET